MTVYIDVWHRTHPLTPAAHERFLDYYGEFVVSPPSDDFEVVGGFKYVDGDSNTDFALYRYASMAMIERAMMNFGADEDYLAATAAVFSEIEIEETRAIAVHSPYATEARLDAVLAESPASKRRYVRVVRKLPAMNRPQAYDALDRLSQQIEAAGAERLVTSFSYLVGPVMDCVELWVLPEGQLELPRAPIGVDPGLLDELARLAPESERRGLEPTRFSRLR